MGIEIDGTSWRSPNWNERALLSMSRREPSMIIIHYTGMESAEGALARLCDPAAEVSAHYVIDEGGRIFRLVEEEQRAWHAGRSYWEGLTDINSASIGIELVNKGHEFGYEDFPQPQMIALKGLLSDLVDRHGIAPDKILGHSDIAPERKIDPGEKFPWQNLAQNGFGLWPQVSAMDEEAAADVLDGFDGDPASAQDVVFNLLAGLGYNPETPYDILIEAFHRHYLPRKLGQEADAQTLGALLALIRQRNALQALV